MTFQLNTVSKPRLQPGKRTSLGHLAKSDITDRLLYYIDANFLGEIIVIVM
jgi:hypothetical protein